MSLLSIYKSQLCEAVAANQEIEDHQNGLIFSDMHASLLRISPTFDPDFFRSVELFNSIQKSLLVREIQSDLLIKTLQDISHREAGAPQEVPPSVHDVPLLFGNESHQAATTRYKSSGRIFAANVIIQNAPQQSAKKRKPDTSSTFESSLRRIKSRTEGELQASRTNLFSSWGERESKTGQALVDHLYSNVLRECLLLILSDAVDRSLARF